MDQLLEIKQLIAVGSFVSDFDFDAIRLFDGGGDGFGGDDIVVGIISGCFEQQFGFAGHFDIVDILLAETVGFGEGAIGVDNIFLKF